MNIFVFSVAVQNKKRKLMAQYKIDPINKPLQQGDFKMTKANSNTSFDKMTIDAADSSKVQMDAAMKSGNIFMKGFEDMTQTYMAFAQKTAEKNAQALKTMLSCKTLNEFTDVQNKWAQQSFDDFMKSTTQLSELSVKVATDAMTPINDELGKSLKKATQSMAA